MTHKIVLVFFNRHIMASDRKANLRAFRIIFGHLAFKIIVLKMQDKKFTFHYASFME